MLLLAAASRLRSRIHSGLADATAQVVTEAELAAQQLQQEWRLFWEEVRLEAERLEQPRSGASAPEPGPSPSRPDTATAEGTEQQPPEEGSGPRPEAGSRKPASSAQVQESIDRLRAEVAGINQSLEQNTL